MPALSVGAAAILAAVVLALQQSGNPQPITTGHRRPDLSARWHIGPTLRELRANFAVLRRPGTARDHAAVAMFTAPTSARPEVPEYVRFVERVEGQPVYFVVYPIFRHGARGAVVAHMMTVVGGNDGGLGGYAYRAGNYAIFPETDAAPGKPTAYVGVVPDGVRSVRWRFACVRDLYPSPGEHASLSGCQLPSPRIATVAVHHNLAVLQTTDTDPYGAGNFRQSYPAVTKVTWYGPAGMSKVFTNANSAVPIPGAPAWTG